MLRHAFNPITHLPDCEPAIVPEFYYWKPFPIVTAAKKLLNNFGISNSDYEHCN
jgi:hypothetical protein